MGAAGWGRVGEGGVLPSQPARVPCEAPLTPLRTDRSRAGLDGHGQWALYTDVLPALQGFPFKLDALRVNNCNACTEFRPWAAGLNLEAPGSPTASRTAQEASRGGRVDVALSWQCPSHWTLGLTSSRRCPPPGGQGPDLSTAPSGT